MHYFHFGGVFCLTFKICITRKSFSFDTTANSSAVMCYYLAKNPSIQKRLQEEIDDFVGDKDATYEHTQQLRFLDACFNESLRLVPVATLCVPCELIKAV